MPPAQIFAIEQRDRLTLLPAAVVLIFDNGRAHSGPLDGRLITTLRLTRPLEFPADELGPEDEPARSGLIPLSDTGFDDELEFAIVDADGIDNVHVAGVCADELTSRVVAPDPIQFEPPGTGPGLGHGVNVPSAVVIRVRRERRACGE